MEKDAPSKVEYSSVIPAFWHEAIRNWYQGYQITPDRFETQKLVAPNGVNYTIYSLTKDNEVGSLPAGIYVATSIPNEQISEAETRTAPIVVQLKELFLEKSKEIGQTGETAIPKEIDETLAALKVTSNMTSAIRLTFNEAKNGRVMVALGALTMEEVAKDPRFKESFARQRDQIIHNFFAEHSYMERIRIVLKETLPPIFVKQILITEIALGELVERKLLMEGELKPEAVDPLADNPEFQEIYKNLLEKIRTHETEEEGTKLAAELHDLGRVGVVGWFRFYRKYWENKYGVL